MKAYGDPRARVVGSLLGLAIGDALGVPVEFESRAQREADPVRGMRDGGTWNRPAGTWSDDCSLALCLAQSIVERGFDPERSGALSLAWLDRGLWTARGEVFGVGGATRRALGRFRSGMPAVLAGGRGENDNGNGGLMRILPASVWLAPLPEPARFRALASYTAVTHGHPRSLLASWLHCLVAGRLLEGEEPRRACASAMAEARELMPSLPLSVGAEAGSFARLLDESLFDQSSSEVRGSGYVLHCLEAALWCLATTGDFGECVLAAVNLGEDADTTGAVAGGLAGLAYGRAAIPGEWLSVLARAGEIEELAQSLAALLEAPPPLPRSYWVLPGKLLAGGYPGRASGRRETFVSEDLGRLLGAGVDAFLDLTQDGEATGSAFYPPELAKSVTGRHSTPERREAPIPDMSADPAAVEHALGELDLLLREGRTVYVHCLGGLGRTGAVVASFLAERGLAPPGEAVGLVKALRAGTDRPGTDSPQTEAQRRLVASRRPGPSALPLP